MFFEKKIFLFININPDWMNVEIIQDLTVSPTIFKNVIICAYRIWTSLIIIISQAILKNGVNSFLLTCL